MLKFVKYILYLLFGLGVVLSIAFFTNKDGMMDTYLFYAYILFGVAAVLAIVLPLIGMVQNPKALKRVLFLVILTAALVGISYLLASGDPVPVNLSTEPTAMTYKITDTGLVLTYILLAVSFVSIIAGSIVNMVRNR
jgi:hypothetical protein